MPFLFKTEPSTYSYADLVREKRAVWDGVTNPVALRHLSTVVKGDIIVIYHTGDEKQAVGLAVAVSDPYPDPKLGDPRRTVVAIEPGKPLKNPVALATVKQDPVLKTTELARLPRLSVMPLTDEHFARILELADSWSDDSPTPATGTPRTAAKKSRASSRG